MSAANAATDSNSDGNGISGGYTGDNPAMRIVIAVFMAVAWYNAAELNIYILLTFKKYRGLYFWSLLISTWGVVFHDLGFFFKFFQTVPNNYVNVFIITIGWWAMVTGQAVVLYSRLDLIVINPVLLRRILWMIIINAIILHLPTTVLTFGSNSNSRDKASFVRSYDVMEKIQMTGFCLQETIISCIYLWESAKFLKNNEHPQPRVLHELFTINIIIIMMDLSLLGLEYANLYILEIIVKGFVYSVKLKLEFAILGKLVQYVNPRTQNNILTGTVVDIPGLYIVSHSITDKGTGHSEPLPIFKRQWTDDPRRGSDQPFEHVEVEAGKRVTITEFGPLDNASRRSVQAQSLNTLSRQASQSDEDLERTMRQYSIGSGPIR